MERNERIEFTAPNTVEIVQRPTPTPGDSEILIETDQSLISSGTETAILTGEFADGTVWDSLYDYPLSPGYCNVGTVIETGNDINDELMGCRVASRTTHVRYAAVDRDKCVLVPETIPTQEAVFLELGKLGLHSLRRGGVELGHATGVFGLGLVGQLLVRLCDAAGAQPIVAFQTSDARREYLPSEPQIVGVDPRDDWEATVEEQTDGRGLDVVFEATGNGDAIEPQLHALREEGRLVIVGSPTEPTPLDLHAISRHSYDVVGAHVYHQPAEPGATNEWTVTRHAELFFNLVGDGVLNIEPLVSHLVSYEEAPSLYETLRTEKSRTMGMLLDW
ncbi:zinc-binding alcohol dehydrogenase [Halogeometricum borinquense]|uniref:Zinc-binding alcohol dehydrogenase n=1 Tax=Halogeometricum borinquense TaxID=60847 RepID=A0A482TKH8_9EURY|nr:zinc-binding alcohol dehydrogenase [Halogeometricum borinquense]RYJ19484.1 zinc-binding alcohol dehydrogenase [Halogeometricum borinquense]